MLELHVVLCAIRHKGLTPSCPWFRLALRPNFRLTLEPKDTEPNTVKLFYQVSTSRHDFSEAFVVASGLANVAWTSEPGLFHATAVINGIEPGQHYYYRFIMPDGPVSPLGAFHAPALSDAPGHRLVHMDRRQLREGAGVDAGATTTSFQLLHFNDVHNHIEGILSNGKTCTADDEVRTRGMARSWLSQLEKSTGQLHLVGFRHTPDMFLAQAECKMDSWCC